MRKNIIIASLLGSSFIIAQTSGVFTSLLLFIVVGQIPGTNISLSPASMGLFYALCSALVLLYALEVRHKSLLRTSYSQLKDRLPKRRFRQA